MNSLEIGARILAGVGLILINAYFVAIEFALTRARQYPESEFDTSGLRRAWEMTDDLEFYLVHLTHGEQTPTYLGAERSKQVCRYGSRPLY